MGPVGHLTAHRRTARLPSGLTPVRQRAPLVFTGGRDKPLRAAAAHDTTPAGWLLAASHGLLAALTRLGLALLLAEVLNELTTFAASDRLQRTVVFAQPEEERLAHGPDPQAGTIAATTATSMSAPGTASPATRAAVTSGGAPSRARSGAIAP